MRHKQREKEYRQKLARLKKEEEADDRTEEDLFKRLDELELEEDLENEMYWSSHFQCSQFIFLPTIMTATDSFVNL